MKVGEARLLYGEQIRQYNTLKNSIAKEKNALDEKMQRSEKDREAFSEQAATLELSYNALNEKQEEYQKYMDNLMLQWEMEFQKVNEKNGNEAAKEYADDYAKIMTVARRIMKGDIVPAKDEKKLMEYDKDIYQMAKNIGMMAKLQKRKKHKSLWEDEKKTEAQDPMKAADEKEAFSDGPEIVSPEELVEDISISEEE